MERIKEAVDVLVVGCGFAGSTLARLIAEEGLKVLIIDKRNHVGGNAYDCQDENGVLVHPYGPHIFHTNSHQVWNFLSQFTGWWPYEHRVLAHVKGKYLPIPINRTTLNELYNLSLETDEQAEAYLAKVRLSKPSIASSEDLVLSSVGEDLCNLFFRGYTKKQWGLDLSDLSAGVAARIPTRTNTDDRYFTDRFQAMPLDGYSKLFEKLLDHPNIQIVLNTDYFAHRSSLVYKHLIYTGPIDRFFDYCYGPLPYRSLRFEHQHFPGVEQFQSVGTVNYPNEYEFTRVTEFKHLTGQTHSGTSIVKEFPTADGDPFYPVPRFENENLFKQYEALADRRSDVTFVGRLAQYRYYNMDQVVAAAMAQKKRVIEKLMVI